jgi:hypothetical protein
MDVVTLALIESLAAPAHRPLRNILTRLRRRVLSEQHRGKASTIGCGQHEQGSGERRKGVGLLRFAVVGANAGTNGRCRRRTLLAHCMLRCVGS